MDCRACEGTGDGRKFGDRNCSICNGSGSVCDVCGEAVGEGEDTCGECMEDDDMKLYAAFSEYQLIWPTTIRYTAEAALDAVQNYADLKPDGNPLAHGTCIGCWNHSPMFFTGGVSIPQPGEIEWIMGWRAPGWNPKTLTNDAANAGLTGTAAEGAKG